MKMTTKPKHIEIDMSKNRLIVDGEDISKETNYCKLLFEDGVWELEMNVGYCYGNSKSRLQKKATN